MAHAICKYFQQFIYTYVGKSLLTSKMKYFLNIEA